MKYDNIETYVSKIQSMSKEEAINYVQEQHCNPLTMVEEFHRAFDHPVWSNPTIPGLDRQDLRYNLLLEEVMEFREACLNYDLVGVADALTDIQYVLAGAVLEFGLAEKFPDLFKEVHRSNMSKACKTEIEAMETATYHEKKDGDPCHIVPRDGLFFVYRSKDMKTIKSINYSPADLKSIVEDASPFPEFPPVTPV